MSQTNLAYKTHYTRGADLVAASTLPLILDGDYFHVSGGTTITALQSIGKGMQVVLRFTESCTIQHTDDQLVLPNDQDIEAESGDLFRFLEYDTGKWILAGSNSHSSSNGTGEFTSPESKARLSSRIDANGEFVSDLSDWTANGGWEWSSSYSGSAYFDSLGGSGTLTQDVPVQEGAHYFGEIKLSGVTGGYVTIDIGSYSIPSGPDSLQFDTDGTYYGGVWATTTGNVAVTITPSIGANPFVGYIEYIRLYRLLPGATPALVLDDDSGAAAIEMFGDATLDNTWVGLNSGEWCYNGENNTCLGYDAGSSIVCGNRNTFIGKDAGEDCTMGNYNTALGDSAGECLTLGSSNTFIGQGAGKDLTDGFANVFVGKDAGGAATDSSNNIFVGYEAGNSNTTAEDNVAIGTGALASNQTNDYNIAIGKNALNYLTDNGYNVVVGNLSALYATDILYSTIVGNRVAESGSLATFGLTAVGYRAAASVTTGVNNVHIGRQCGQNLTSGQDNVIIGTYAGNVDPSSNLCTSMSDNVIIGDSAEPGAYNSTNEIVIGSAAEGSGTNTTTIGTSSTTDAYINGEVHCDGADINGNTDIDGTLDVSGAFGLANNMTITGSYGIDVNSKINLYGASGNIQMDGVLELDGGQIQFPATQDASAGSNTFDDYEEGTFTPVITVGGSTTGITYSYQHGRYTKIGDMVSFQLDLGLSDRGTFTNTDLLLITGLPFTNASTRYSNLSIRHDNAWCNPNMVAYITNSAATITPGWSTSTTSGFNQMQYDSIADSTQFHISGHYYV